jgi:hypothetical protein
MDLRHLCTSAACLHASTTLVALEDGSAAIYCDECSETIKQSAFFVSARPLAMVERLM